MLKKKKRTELFKQHANQHTEGAAATECTNWQVLTTNCHLPRFALSISRRATPAEPSPCTSCLSEQWQSDNERAWRMCVWNFATNLVWSLQRHFSCLTKHMGRTVWSEHRAMSGLSILKRAECRSVKTPGLDDLPHKQTMTMTIILLNNCFISQKSVSRTTKLSSRLCCSTATCNSCFQMLTPSWFCNQRWNYAFLDTGSYPQI